MKKSKTNATRAAAAAVHSSAAIEHAADLDYLIEMFFCELSDEAATHIAEFLMQLALCFEGTHLSQIRRYHQATQLRPDYDPRQLELFEPF